MTGKGASTYYQLAVSRRQLIGGAVVVALLLVVEFAGGVWLGLRHVASGEAESAGFLAGSLPAAVPLPEPTPTPPRLAEAAALSPTPSPVQPGGGSPPAAPATAPVPAPTASPSPSPTATPVPSSPTTAAATEVPAPSPGWYVQLLATTDEAEATELATRLGDAGYPVVTLRSGRKDAPLLRVRIGPYRDRSQADELAAALGRRLDLEPWVTR